MNDSIFITFLLTAVALLFIGGFFYCHHERRLQDIERQGGDRSNRSVLLSIERFVKIIAVAAVLFCTGVAIHYCCVFFPRYISDDANKAYYENFGVDYWGIVVGFMALLVTLLVGWQIYATIRARQELNDTKDEIEERFKNRLKEFDGCCKARGEQIEEINRWKYDFESHIESLVDVKYRTYEARLYFAQATTLSLFADLESSIKEDCYKPLSKNEKEVKFQYSLAYRYYFEALIYYAQSMDNYTAIESCISNMQVNLKRFFDSNEKFEVGAYKRCDSLYDKFMSLVSDKGIDSTLVEHMKELHEKRITITPYDITKDTGIKIVSVDSDSEAFRNFFNIVKEARLKRIAEEQSRQSSDSKNDETSGD